MSRQLAPYLATPVTALRRALRDLRCGAVICQEYEYPRFDVCVALGRGLRLPVVATFQGGDEPQTALERLIRPLTMRSADGFVIGPASEATRVRERYGVAGYRIARIFNPLNGDRWQHCPSPRLDASSASTTP